MALSIETLERICNLLPKRYFKTVQRATRRIDEIIRVAASGECSEAWSKQEMNDATDALMQAEAIHAEAGYVVGVCDGLRMAQKQAFFQKLDAKISL